MKQVIDFYKRLGPEESTSKSLSLMMVSWVVLLLGYFLFTLSLSMEQDERQGVLKRLVDSNTLLEDKIAREVNKAKRVNLDLLQAELNDLRRQQQQQQQLIGLLLSPRFGNLEGFSNVLKGLARQHQRGIAIEKIEVTQNGNVFFMAGKVINPMDVPAYIVRLGDEEAFEDMAFENIIIEETGAELSFEVRSWTKSGKRI